MFKSWSRRGHKRVCIEHTLFPGYAFITIGETQGFPHRRENPWLTGLVGVRGSPLKIQDQTIADLRTRIVAGEFNPRRRPLLQAGQPVRITSGLMTGIEGVVETATETRARLVVTLFGHALPVSIRVADLIYV
jgi:transcription antitermination factor NusG